MTDPARAIAYLRCSTNRQDLSPETQREAIRTWAEQSYVTIVSWHFDKGVSGGAGSTVVETSSLSRVARQSVDGGPAVRELYRPSISDTVHRPTAMDQALILKWRSTPSSPASS